MFAPPLNPQELAFWGLTPEDVAAQNQVEVWADNWQAVELLERMGTQWRVGFGGAYALDYNVLFQMPFYQNLPRDEREFFLYQIRVLESAALDVMHKDK